MPAASGGGTEQAVQALLCKTHGPSWTWGADPFPFPGSVPAGVGSQQWGGVQEGWSCTVPASARASAARGWRGDPAITCQEQLVCQ